MEDVGVFPVDAKTIHDNLAAADKTLQFLPGDHYMENPAAARDDMADRVASWLEQRGA
jgi:hypothetical protein